MTTVLAPRGPLYMLCYECELCSRRLEPVHWQDAGCWSVRGLAMRGKRKHKAVLCWRCFQEAEAAGSQRVAQDRGSA